MHFVHRSALQADPEDPAWVAGRDAAVAATAEWFGRHSGWAPPEVATLAEWMADGVCRCPDECLVAPDESCRHGLATWWSVLTAPRRAGPLPAWDPTLLIPSRQRLDLTGPGALAAIEAHEDAVETGQPAYTDPRTGYLVMTARTLWDRGRCCGQGCRHCPFLPV